MPIDSQRRRPRATILTVLVIAIAACLGLAACGGSSSSTSSSKTASTSSTTNRPGASRFTALRACLQKNGINLPQRPAGQRPPNGSHGPGGPGGLLGGGSGAGSRNGPKLPAGVTRTQYQAALKKCGGAGFSRNGGARLNSGVFRQALTKLATCMRQNGIDLPAPNTSGKGPVFNTKGLDTSSSKFKTAYAKCQSALRGSVGGGPGAGGPGAGAPGPGTPGTAG
jgi:hypothetical protein